MAGGGQIGLLNRGLAQVHVVAETAEVDLHTIKANLARDFKAPRVGFAQRPFGSADFKTAPARRGKQRGKGGTECQRCPNPCRAPDHLPAAGFGEGVSQ